MTPADSPGARISVLESRQKATDSCLQKLSTDMDHLTTKMTELVTLTKLGRTVFLSAFTVGPGLGVVIAKLMA